MIWRTAASAFLLAFCIRAWAIELDPACHRLYEMFNLPNLTYEDVGKIADKMHENECWPVLQGVDLGSTDGDTPIPAITDCSSLVPHIVQMTKNQATQANPAILKLYGIRELDVEFCKKTGLVFEMPSADGKTTLVTDARTRNMMTDEFANACYGVIRAKTTGVLTDPTSGKPHKVLNCVGTAKYASGYSGDQPRYFYLERFSDGEEFFGISALYR